MKKKLTENEEKQKARKANIIIGIIEGFIVNYKYKVIKNIILTITNETLLEEVNNLFNKYRTTYEKMFLYEELDILYKLKKEKELEERKEEFQKLFLEKKTN